MDTKPSALKPTLPFLEIMATQTCNFSCQGCSNYSDVPHKGFLTWQDAHDQILPWLERLNIADFGIIGGEPLLVPDIITWIYGARQLLPDSQIRFTTNGSLLYKFPDIMRVFLDIGNCVFKISRHHHDPRVDDIIQDIRQNYEWVPVVEHGITRWTVGDRVRLQINRPETFVKIYRGPNYHHMRPYHSQPEEAFAYCCQKDCPLLYQGRIYKCSSNGLLADLLEKFNPVTREEWDQYLDPGIGHDCTAEELDSFLSHFGRPYRTCSMCPTALDQESKIPHWNKISFSKVGI